MNKAEMNIKNECEAALERIYALIDSRCKGMRISIGRRVAKARREIIGDYCECGQPWESDMDQFGCWSCGAERPTR